MDFKGFGHDRHGHGHGRGHGYWIWIWIVYSYILLCTIQTLNYSEEVDTNKYYLLKSNISCAHE